MHHDPSSAAIALEEYEHQRRHEHSDRQRRQVQLFAIGRIFIAVLFIASAAAKIADYSSTVRALDNSLSDASMLLPIAIAVELIGGLALLFGFKARIVSIGLIGYLATVTLLMHHDLANPLNRTFALANLAFAGALLMIYAHGAGVLSVDRALQQKDG
jgi:putative oxidoreductase